MSDLIDRDALKDATKELYNETLDGIVKFGIEKAYDLIDTAPTASPKEVCIANVHFDKEQLQEIVDEAIADYQLEPIRCKDCKHQKKYWHEDKRMKDKGYWVYDCEFIDDPFTGTPVCGQPDEFCSSAERRVSDEPQ